MADSMNSLDPITVYPPLSLSDSVGTAEKTERFIKYSTFSISRLYQKHPLMTASSGAIMHDDFAVILLCCTYIQVEYQYPVLSCQVISKLQRHSVQLWLEMLSMVQDERKVPEAILKSWFSRVLLHRSVSGRTLTSVLQGTARASQSSKCFGRVPCQPRAVSGLHQRK